jgi:hypothetical protein
MCIEVEEITEDQKRSAPRTLLKRDVTSEIALFPLGENHLESDRQKWGVE